MNSREKMEKGQTDRSPILPLKVGEVALPEQRECHSPCGNRKDRRPFYRLCIVIFSLFAVWKLAGLFPDILVPSALDRLRQAQVPDLRRPTQLAENRKVDLEVHIMSKCPDAKACLQELVVPAMEKLDEIIDFKLSFIGRFGSPSLQLYCDWH